MAVKVPALPASIQALPAGSGVQFQDLLYSLSGEHVRLLERCQYLVAENDSLRLLLLEQGVNPEYSNAQFDVHDAPPTHDAPPSPRSARSPRLALAKPGVRLQDNTEQQNWPSGLTEKDKKLGGLTELAKRLSCDICAELREEMRKLSGRTRFSTGTAESSQVSEHELQAANLPRSSSGIATQPRRLSNRQRRSGSFTELPRIGRSSSMLESAAGSDESPAEEYRRAVSPKSKKPNMMIDSSPGDTDEISIDELHDGAGSAVSPARVVFSAQAAAASREIKEELKGTPDTVHSNPRISKSSIEVSLDDNEFGDIHSPDFGEGERESTSKVVFSGKAAAASREVDKMALERTRYFHKQVAGVVNSTMFDYISASLVIMNSVAIGIQVDYNARNILSYSTSEFRFMDILFCIVFALELCIRMFAFGSQFFCVADWKWNAFDFCLVTLQVFDEVLTAMAEGSTWGMNFSFMRVLRILRLVRIMRMIRILRLIQELRTIVTSIMGSLKSLLWTVLLLFMLVYVFAVFLTQQVLDFRVSLAGDESHEHDGGIDWDHLAEPLMNRISVSLGVVLSVYTALAILALMNVVTGVFVESAMVSAKEDRTSYMLQHVKELFAEADPDNLGSIGWSTFQGCLQRPFMKEFFQSIDVDLSDAKGVFALLDTDDSGEVDLEEFLNGCLGLHGPAQAIHLATLMYESRITQRFQCTHLTHIVDTLQQVVETIPSIASELGDVTGPVVDAALLGRRSYYSACKDKEDKEWSDNEPTSPGGTMRPKKRISQTDMDGDVVKPKKRISQGEDN